MPESSTIQRSRKQQEWINFLKTIDWDYFMTINAYWPMTKKQSQSIGRKLEKFICGGSQDNPAVFWISEHPFGGRRRHMHALLKTNKSFEALRHFCGNIGRSDIQRFDGEQGGIGYVTKWIDKEEQVEYGLAVGR